MTISTSPVSTSTTNIDLNASDQIFNGLVELWTVYLINQLLKPVFGGARWVARQFRKSFESITGVMIGCPPVLAGKLPKLSVLFGYFVQRQHANVCADPQHRLGGHRIGMESPTLEYDEVARIGVHLYGIAEWLFQLVLLRAHVPVVFQI